MRSVERRGEIGASAEAIFAFLADIENLPRWQPGVSAARAMTDGPLRIGSVARVTTRVMGQDVEADVTVRELDAPHRLAFDSEVSSVRVAADVDIAAMGPDRSDVRLGLDVSASGFTKFMEPVIANAAESELTGALDRVRAALESPKG